MRIVLDRMFDNPHPRAGASRFDGETWTTFSTAYGLAHDDVHAIAAALDGAIWFGMIGGGVTHYQSIE